MSLEAACWTKGVPDSPGLKVEELFFISCFNQINFSSGLTSSEKFSQWFFVLLCDKQNIKAICIECGKVLESESRKQEVGIVSDSVHSELQSKGTNHWASRYF